MCASGPKSGQLLLASLLTSRFIDTHPNSGDCPLPSNQICSCRRRNPACWHTLRRCCCSCWAFHWHTRPHRRRCAAVVNYRWRFFGSQLYRDKCSWCAGWGTRRLVRTCAPGRRNRCPRKSRNTRRVAECDVRHCSSVADRPFPQAHRGNSIYHSKWRKKKKTWVKQEQQ